MVENNTNPEMDRFGKVGAGVDDPLDLQKPFLLLHLLLSITISPHRPLCGTTRIFAELKFLEEFYTYAKTEEKYLE